MSTFKDLNDYQSQKKLGLNYLETLEHFEISLLDFQINHG